MLTKLNYEIIVEGETWRDSLAEDFMDHLLDVNKIERLEFTSFSLDLKNNSSIIDFEIKSVLRNWCLI